MQYSTRVKSELIKIGGKYLFDIANDLLQLGREILFIFYFFKNIKKKKDILKYPLKRLISFSFFVIENSEESGRMVLDHSLINE